MPITIDSTTDSQAEITQALGGAQASDQTPAAEANPSAENPDASGTSEAVEPNPSEPVEAGLEDAASTEDLTQGTKDPNAAHKPSKNGVQKRIDKLTREKSELQRELEFYREKALRTNDVQTGNKPETQAPVVDSNKKPVASEFETIEAYTEALTDWKVDQKLKAQSERQKAEDAKNQQSSRIQKHQEKVAQFQASHDDWEDVMDGIRGIPLSLSVQEAVLSSEDSAELFYELAKNPEELRRISQMDTVSAARAIGRFEAKISKPQTQQAVIEKTKAPAPVNPVGANSAAVSRKTIFDEDISQAEFERLIREQKKAQGF